MFVVYLSVLCISKLGQILCAASTERFKKHWKFKTTFNEKQFRGFFVNFFMHKVGDRVQTSPVRENTNLKYPLTKPKNYIFKMLLKMDVETCVTL